MSKRVSFRTVVLPSHADLDIYQAKIEWFLHLVYNVQLQKTFIIIQKAKFSKRCALFVFWLKIFEVMAGGLPTFFRSTMHSTSTTQQLSSPHRSAERWVDLPPKLWWPCCRNIFTVLFSCFNMRLYQSGVQEARGSWGAITLIASLPTLNCEILWFTYSYVFPWICCFSAPTPLPAWCPADAFLAPLIPIKILMENQR